MIFTPKSAPWVRVDDALWCTRCDYNHDRTRALSQRIELSSCDDAWWCAGCQTHVSASEIGVHGERAARCTWVISQSGNVADFVNLCTGESVEPPRAA